MSEHKKKLALPRLNPPQPMYWLETFAFSSKYPLDVCARRLTDENTNSFVERLSGVPPARGRISAIGLNEQHFILSSGPLTLLRCWAVGTIRDVDGQATWVEGEIGIGAVAWWRGFLMSVVAIAMFVLSLGFVATSLICLPMPILSMWLVVYTYDLRGSKARIRKHVCEVFGIPEAHPMPVYNPPVDEAG